VTCMTSLLTLTELDGAYRLIPDIAQRLALERETLARSPYLHGLTESALAKTIRDYGLTPAATAVIGRGLEDRAAGELSAAANGRWAAADHRGTRVLFVGRIEPRKGVDLLIMAARELIEDGVPVSILLAGPEADPSYRQALERQARDQSRLGEAVRFAGAVSDPLGAAREGRCLIASSNSV
jgi:glycosyltransferase involved in cell wall biosynthesis